MTAGRKIWAKSAGTAIGFILGGAIVLLVQNGLAQGHAADHAKASRELAANLKADARSQ